MTKTILITGASGFTGIHACEYFAKQGYRVFGTVRKMPSVITENTELIVCDLANEQDIDKLVHTCKPDYLLHLAGQNHVGTSWEDPVQTLEINAMSTAYLLQAATKHTPDCKVLIVGSALQTDPQDISSIPHPYSLSKTLQTLIALSWTRLYNMDVMVAKPSNLIGPGNSNGVCAIFIKNILHAEKSGSIPAINVQNIAATRDFVDVRDCISAYEYIFLKGRPMEVYDITTGDCHSLQTVLEHLQTITGATLNITAASNDSSDSFPEIQPKKLLALGWKQKQTLASSLSDMIDYYRSYP